MKKSINFNIGGSMSIVGVDGSYGFILIVW